MKTSQTAQDGTAQGAQYSADSTNNLSYVVSLEIHQYDKNRKHTVLIDKKTTFTGERAIDCRKKALAFVFQLHLDANIKGKLCKNHLDTPMEAMRKGMKNFTCLFIEVTCKDKHTGEELTISEGDFSAPPKDYIEECSFELNRYKEYGYDTEDRVITAKDPSGREFKILDYLMFDEEYVENFFAKAS